MTERCRGGGADVLLASKLMSHPKCRSTWADTQVPSRALRQALRLLSVCCLMGLVAPSIPCSACRDTRYPSLDARVARELRMMRLGLVRQLARTRAVLRTTKHMSSTCNPRPPVRLTAVTIRRGAEPCQSHRSHSDLSNPFPCVTETGRWRREAVERLSC